MEIVGLGLFFKLPLLAVFASSDTSFPHLYVSLKRKTCHREAFEQLLPWDQETWIESGLCGPPHWDSPPLYWIDTFKGGSLEIHVSGTLVEMLSKEGGSGPTSHPTKAAPHLYFFIDQDLCIISSDKIKVMLFKKQTRLSPGWVLSG